MSSKTQKNKQKLTREPNQSARNTNTDGLNRRWMSMRGGIRIITVISVALGLFTSYNLRAGGLGQSLLWGLIIGGSIWLVFFLVLYVNSIIYRRPKQ